MKDTPERGKSEPCKICGVQNANQHSLRESGICDGLRAGKLVRASDGRIVEVK